MPSKGSIGFCDMSNSILFVAGLVELYRSHRGSKGDVVASLPQSFTHSMGVWPSGEVGLPLD